MLVEFGFNGELLTSQNATIIIAYYLHKGGDSSPQSKSSIRKYLIHALLNGIYGSSQDQLLSTLRNAFRTEIKQGDGTTSYQGRFTTLSFEDVLKIELPQQKSLAVTETDLERFLGHTKGPASFFVLTLLYPHLRYNDAFFHQDHIHPFSGFTDEALKTMGIPEDQRAEWYARRDCVPNLQLLNDRRNISKNDTPITDWVKKMTDAQRAAFISENYFPQDIGLEFKKFIAFFDQRKENLRIEMRKVLAMAPLQTDMTTTDTTWSRSESGLEESEVEG